MANMIFTEKPQDFNSRFDGVFCFVEHEGEILLLHRNDGKSEGNKWGMPGGKINAGENSAEAVVREIREETGLRLTIPQVTYFRAVYVRYPDYDFVFHMFHATVDQKQDAVLNPSEHKNFRWISPEEALGLELVGDLGECIKLRYPAGPTP